MDDQISVSVSIPTDDDGYVRQQCPSCGREFKAPVEDDELVTPEHCPYCGHQDDQWFTQEQMEQFEAQALAAVMPQLNADLKKMARGVERSSGGLLTMDVKGDDVDVPVMAPEAPDMAIVTSPCCDASLKLEESWSGTSYCPSCGIPYEV
jgi:DNA-directed RNA polymerase subunit RPC12/RpoP